jgi:hypothetical protein
MDPAVLTASAAVLGSLAGASASLATAWLSQKTQGRRALIQAEVHKREVLYSDFITECAKLYLDALEHSLERPEIFQPVYSLASRIRLVSDDAVVREAEAAIKALLDLYRAPNLSIEKLREMSPAELQDPLRPFSEACRQELQSLKVQVPL